MRRGKHGARSPQQAIAIGLSKARRAGVPLPPPAPGKAKETTRKSAEHAYRKGQTLAGKKPARRYTRVREEALKREPKSTASHAALSKQGRSAARRRKAAAASTGKSTQGRSRAGQRRKAA